MNSDFARIITLQRKERHISQKQAATDLGISQALLSHYEKGIRECGLNFLVKIADYYNVSCDYLLGRTPEPEGKTISIEDIPDDDGNNNLKMPSPEIINFNRRIINNSISLLFSLAQYPADGIVDPPAFCPHESYDLPVRSQIRCAYHDPAVRLLDAHGHSLDTFLSDLHREAVDIYGFGHT